VYRPQAVPKVLQRKTIAAAHKGHTHPVAPPVYRPSAKKIVQPMIATDKRLPGTPFAPHANQGTMQGRRGALQAGNSKLRGTKDPRAGTVQMYTEVKVPYDKNGPSKDAHTMRMDNNVPPGRNIATFSFKARPGKMGVEVRESITASSTGFYDPTSNLSHSERQIIGEITPIEPFSSKLYKDEVVDWVYTERRPCPMCRPQLKGIEDGQKLVGWDDANAQYKYGNRQDNLVDLTVYFSFEKEGAKRELKTAMQQAGKAEDQINEAEEDVETGESQVRPGNWATDLRSSHIFAFSDRLQEHMEDVYVSSGSPEEYDTTVYDSYPGLAMEMAQQLVPQFRIGKNRVDYEDEIKSVTNQYSGNFFG
jgi:hypothetical protein